MNSEAEKSQAVQYRAHNDEAGYNDTADAVSVWMFHQTFHETMIKSRQQ